jgi:hypothetical protein
LFGHLPFRIRLRESSAERKEWESLKRLVFVQDREKLQLRSSSYSQEEWQMPREGFQAVGQRSKDRVSSSSNKLKKKKRKKGRAEAPRE